MAKWLLLLSMLLSWPALAGDGADVRDLLSRPGVKPLAAGLSAPLLVLQTREPGGRSEMQPYLSAFHMDEGAAC